MRASRNGRLTVATLALAATLAGGVSANESTVPPAAPKSNAPAPTAIAKSVNAKSATNPAKPANVAKVPGNAAAAKNVSSARPGSDAARNGRTRLASTSSSGAPVVIPVTPTGGAPAPGSTLAHLDEHLTYQYNALGRRDPFQALVGGGFVPMDQGGEAPPDIGGIKVVGIVWGASDQFALVEDARGSSFVLRKGDKVQNGYVEGLKRDGVIVNVTADGQSQTVVVPLSKKGEQK